MSVVPCGEFNGASLIIQFITALYFRYYLLDVLASALMGPLSVLTVCDAKLILYERYMSVELYT